jgi:hypothetical protein
LSNGSKIITAPSKGVRGDDSDILFLDEMAFLPASERFFAATYPIIAKRENARIIIASTPNGHSGEYFQQWEAAVKRTSRFIPIRWRYENVPGYNEAFKQETIANIGQERWDTEFECKFREKSRDNTPGVNIDNITINGVPQKNIGIKYGKYFLPIYSSHKNTKTLFKLSEVLEGLSSKEINIILEALNKLLLDKSIFNI